MQREFLPYSNLWITADNWIKNCNSWLNDPFETLDAPGAERFVDEGGRTLTGCMRFFRERQIEPILKIAQKVKQQFDEFKPKVPLMVALRKPGMMDRHWKQISEATKFEVKPVEGFNFQKCLDMGLMNFVDQCVDIGEKAYKEY